MPIPVPSGGTLYFKFTTRGTTGLPTTLSGSPVVSVYKDASTTESTAGVTLTADFDSRTGLNHVSIDTSADGTFYANGHTFYLTITTGTVGGTSVVGEVVGEFELGFPLVQLADGVAHGGTPGSSTATYAGAQWNITNSSGTAVIFASSGGNGNAFSLQSNGSGSSFKIYADQDGTTGTGRGVEVVPGGASGNGIDVYAPNGAGCSLYGDSGNLAGSSGLLIGGSGSSPVVLIYGNDGRDPATGIGIKLDVASHGIQIIPFGTAANTHGVNIAGGSVSGDAVHKTATDGHGDFSQGGNGKAAVVPGTLAIGS